LRRQVDQPSIFGVALFGETPLTDFVAGILRARIHSIRRHHRIAVGERCTIKTMR